MVFPEAFSGRKEMEICRLLFSVLVPLPKIWIALPIDNISICIMVHCE